MTATTPTHPSALVQLSGEAEEPARNSLPPKPDPQLWEADEAEAFEAGVRWFLAVSRTA